MPVDFRRSEPSKTRLEIDWNFPVYTQQSKRVAPGRTTTEVRRHALDRDRALVEIGGDERKPLLVVRECGFCKGTDDALLSRRMKNEKTLLMTRWFRCVKLPNHVLEGDHPFHNLFAGEHPPHLFLCRPDGSDVVALDGQQTQSELWEAMEGLIEESYERVRVDRVVKKLLRCLDDFDAVESRITEFTRQREERIDRKGLDDRRVRRLQRQIEELEHQRAEIEERWDEILEEATVLKEPERSQEAAPSRG